MAFNAIKNNVAYGLNNALQNLSPLPVVALRAPTSSDVAEIGTYWIYNNEVWMFTSASNWTQLATDSGSGTFDSLTVNGTSTLNGAITAVTSNGAITLSSGTAATNIGTDSAAKTITIGNVTGATAVNIHSGTGGIILNSNSTGDILLTPDSVTATSYTFTQNARIGAQSILNPSSIATSATISIVMTNSFLSDALSTPVLCTVTTNSTAGGLLQINGMLIGADTLTISATNVGSAAIPAGGSSNIIVSFIVLN